LLQIWRNSATATACDPLQNDRVDSLCKMINKNNEIKRKDWPSSN
jgi:hypothetical protein